MREIVWLDSAINDLVRLRGFITKKNPMAAQSAAEAIQKAVELLMAAPSMGKPVNELQHYRDLLTRFGVGGYVLRYRVYAEKIYIVHIRHYREADFKL